MKLEDIGFYTLEDKRAVEVNAHSPMWRCELILTDVCNFKCPYCRTMKEESAGDMKLSYAKHVVDLWTNDGLKNIRFSGGEPTMWKGLVSLVAHTKKKPSIERIAISTNGSAHYKYYERLVRLGVNDFSISLDACCASTADEMAGVKGKFKTVTDNISRLSKLTYVTVGVVINQQNIKEGLNTIKFADNLGVSDIRVISSAQFNGELTEFVKTEKDIREKNPILKYRLNNFMNGRSVRGIELGDSNKCRIVMDDSCIAGKHHYPCIIHFRERGDAIGKVGENMRQERINWSRNHNTQLDPICRKNCLDVCIDYNNKAEDNYDYQRKDGVGSTQGGMPASRGVC
jgi:molybdenum cofactor biosynthesis enzyme MoaA